MEIIDFISTERLQTYSAHTDREKKAIALHNQTLQLGSSLMSMIALLELSIRNSTNKQLVLDFGDPDWLVPGHSTVPLEDFEKSAVGGAVSHAKKAAYSKLTYKDKSALDSLAFPNGKPVGISHGRLVKARQETIAVSHGQIIAQTNISFWKRLYSSSYEDLLWRASLKKVFPNKELKRSDISKPLEVVYAARNRVAHHEPMYGVRLDDTISAIEFIRNALGAKKGEDDTKFKKFSRLQYLRLRMDYESFKDAWHTLT